MYIYYQYYQRCRSYQQLTIDSVDMTCSKFIFSKGVLMNHFNSEPDLTVMSVDTSHCSKCKKGTKLGYYIEKKDKTVWMCRKCGEIELGYTKPKKKSQPREVTMNKRKQVTANIF